MTLYQLKVFEAVARRLNITQASLELHASKPAVSLQLKRLEDAYSATYLMRHNHGVKLTREGRAFLQAITPVLAQLHEIDRRFERNQNTKPAQRLIIGGSRSIA